MCIDKTVENLKAHRFIAKVFQTVEEAKQEIIEIVGMGSVGIGGSRTIKDAGLRDSFVKNGNCIYDHASCKPGEKEQSNRAALNADYYLCSANAITQDGCILNIDGGGNRVAATLYGPHSVIILAGKNKIVRDVETGIARIRSECCPENARRHGYKTPCAITGKCTDCSSPERICNAAVLHYRPTRNVERFYVFIVDKDLGL